MDNLKNKKLFLLDMDGTIYLDDMLFEGALDFLSYVKSINGKYMFLTNNSSKSVDKYIDILKGLGIKAQEEDFLTSTNATVLHLQKAYCGKKIYAFGTESFKQQLKKGGINIVDTLEDGIDCLVMGFDTELTFQKLEDACILLNRGVDYIATNPDWVCPTWYGYVPDCGSVSEMLYRATKRRPVFIGKPEPTMALLAIEKSGFSKEETLIIGDRIYTDIACGINAGVSTALVLSGETALNDVKESSIKPEFVFDNIKKIYETLIK
ncbi:MAG: HAD-IIA family hydrolase [Eubacteriales bacterium]|jgi:HAD superfamily hydrolase (TIGR01457 family)|nr:HAD-IIA family hydrolase [Eubacteriales bacterium]